MGIRHRRREAWKKRKPRMTSWLHRAAAKRKKFGIPVGVRFGDGLLSPLMSKLPRVFIVRHGNTDWAETHRYTGRTDLPLNARGEQNARNLAARLAGLSFARVFCSPLKRARRTCELAGFGERAEIDDDLLEWDYGQIDGKSSIEFRAENPRWSLFRDGAPGGESPAQIVA